MLHCVSFGMMAVGHGREKNWILFDLIATRQLNTYNCLVGGDYLAQSMK